MSLVQTRVNRALDEARDRLLAQGVPVSLDRLREAVRDVRAPDRPIMAPVRQEPRSNFDLKAHNQAFWAANEDFLVLFEVLFRQAEQSLSNLRRGDLLLRRSLYYSRVLSDLLQQELLRATDVSGFFLGAFDTFRDLSKVNLSSSTVAVDLGTESVRLKRDQADTLKLDLSFLRSLHEAPLSVVDGNHVLRTRVLPGQGFGNCFDSLQSAYQQEIVSTKPDGISVEIVIRLSLDGSSKRVTSVVLDLLMSIVSVEGAASSPDGSNFSSFSSIRTAAVSGTKIRLYTPTEASKALRLRLHIPMPSSQVVENGGLAFSYYVSLREIEVYTEGFQNEGVLVSTVLSPEEVNGFTSIDKVSLVVEEELPEGAEIEYEIAPDSNPTAFRRISPLNRRAPDVPDVIDFDQLVEIFPQSNRVDVSSSTPHTFTGDTTPLPKNGITFYDVYTFPDTPRFMSVGLRRGIDGWRIVKREGPTRVLTERGNQISFETDDGPNQLYVNVSGEEVRNHPASDGAAQTQVSTSFPLLEDQDSVPSASVSNAQSPYYIVGRAILRPSPGTRTTPLVFTQGADGVLLRVGTVSQGLAGEKVLEFPSGLGFTSTRLIGQRISLSYTGLGGTSIAGSFAIKQIVDDQEKVLLILQDPDGFLEPSGTNALTATVESLDVSGDIEATDSSSVYFDLTLEILRGDVIVLDYRRRLLSTELLLPSTVEVIDPDSRVAFVIDKDYTVDSVNGTIIKIAGGSIQTRVRATFSYESRTLGLYTYECFVTVPAGTNRKVRVEGFSLLEGESSSIQLHTGDISLDKRSEISLLPGTYRVLVVSKPLLVTSSGVDTSTALYKTINSLDLDGGYVFGPGRYFERQEAFSGPLRETSVFRLQSSVLRDDHSFFAVDGDVLIFNHDPLGRNTKVLTIVPGASSFLNKEKMEIGYKYLPNTDEPVTGAILRATLRLLPGTKPDRTPVLHSYDMRFLHG